MQEIVYKIELDGIITYEEYDTIQKAKQGALIKFSKNKKFKEAEIVEVSKLKLGIKVTNTQYEGTI